MSEESESERTRERQPEVRFCVFSRKVDVRLPGKGNSNSHGARPVHLGRSTVPPRPIALSLCIALQHPVSGFRVLDHLFDQFVPGVALQ